MPLVHDFVQVVAHPFAAFPMIREHRRLPDGVLALALALGIPMLAAELAALGPYRPPPSLGSLPADAQQLGDAFSRWLFGQRFVLPLYDAAAGLLLWVLAASLIHLLARGLGGRGGFPGYLTMAGYVALLGLCTLPVTLLQAGLQATGNGQAADRLAPASAGLGLAIFAWQNVLLILGARLHYGISTERAVTAVVGPVAAVAVLLAALILAIALLAVATARLGP